MASPSSNSSHGQSQGGGGGGGDTQDKGIDFLGFLSLKSAIELDIPDIINNHGRPMTLSELISSLPNINKSKSPCISRLMRILVHTGFFVKQKINSENTIVNSEKDEEGYLLTPYMLQNKEILKQLLDPVVLNAWLHMGEWFRNEDFSPFVTAHGVTYFDYMDQNPKFNSGFHASMAKDAEIVAAQVLRECRGAFEGLTSVVDVGGGTGTFAKAISEAFPLINCINFDLPHVVAGLEGTKNLTHVEGDMFKAVPQANAAIIKWVLHNWSDEECIKILTRCKEAIPSKAKGGKLMIIDMVVEEAKDDKTREEQIFFDVLMMVLTSGKERNEKEWANLFIDAGFSDYKITSVLGSKSLIEVYP